MSHLFNLFSKAFLLSIVSVVLVGCGDQVKIIDSSVVLEKVGSDSYVRAQTTLQARKLVLPNFDYPIPDPRRDNDTIIGYLSSRQIAAQRGNLITVYLNLEAALRAPLVDPVLPNGAPFPIAGLDDAVVVGLAVPQTQAKVYVAMKQGVAVVGTTIPVQEFDSLADRSPGLTLFPSGCFSSGVCATGGIYLGRQTGQSGIGVFVDGSSVIYPSNHPEKLIEPMVIHQAPRSFIQNYIRLENNHPTGQLHLH